MSKQNELVQFSRGASGGGSKNLIINGGQQIWQRATATTTVTNSGYNTVDRFRYYVSGGGAYTSTRSTDVPSGQGFSYSNKLDVTTADTSLASSDYYSFRQRIEAQNLARLAYGTSGAKTITLSFWIKSNKTGIYTIQLYKFDNTNYTYVKEYTINSANTWEKKTITINPTAGSTTLITNSGGAIDVDNGIGLQVTFNLSMGNTYTGATNDAWSANGNHATTTNAINWMDSTSNNLYLTGVQLEANDTSTDFEFENYGTTLSKCQRYFCRTYAYGTATGTATSNGCLCSVIHSANNWAGCGNFHYPVEMRATPTVTLYSTYNANTTGKVTADATDGAGGVNFNTTTRCMISRQSDSAGTGASVFMRAHATADAEL